MVGYRKQGFGAGSQSVVRADRKPGKCRNSRGRFETGPPKELARPTYYQDLNQRWPQR